MDITIAEICARAHGTARVKGWLDRVRSYGEEIALMHSELSEALEDIRNGYAVHEVRLEAGGKPCGVPTELADVVIRIAQFCAAHDIDLAAAIDQKMRFNESRPYRHGGKVL